MIMLTIEIALIIISGHLIYRNVILASSFYINIPTAINAIHWCTGTVFLGMQFQKLNTSLPLMSGKSQYYRENIRSKKAKTFKSINS